MANIVFIVDESGSVGSAISWLSDLVTGNRDLDPQPEADNLSQQLANNGITDVCYGLVGYAEQKPSGFSLGQSHVVGTDPGKTTFERLWSDGATAAEHIDDLAQAITHLNPNGDNEDGWDAIDHAFAEYDFRPGAIPIFVHIQEGEGRFDINKTLTHDGILAALKSKNVILNSLVVSDGSGLFDLSPYESTAGDFADVIILGVEASKSGNGQHTYHAYDTGTDSVPATLPTTTADTLQISYNGSNTGATGMVGSGKSILIGTKISGGIGPAAAGYQAKSIPFQIVNMSTGTTTVTPGTSIPSYSFTFYGTTYNNVYVNQDRTITFGAANASGDNADLSFDAVGPNRPTMPMIAALWDDLAAGNGNIRRKLVDVDQDGTANDMVIQWNSYKYNADIAPSDPITFQVILFADGRIQLNYQDIDSFSGLENDPTVTITGGINATVGIWKGSIDAIVLPAGKFVPGPHSVFGATSGETNDSYVRMAWDTGGAAWDIDVVQAFRIESDPADALRDAFIESLATQIEAAADLGKVARSDEVVYALNAGGAIPAEGFTAGLNSTVSTSNTIDTTSNSIPLVGNPAAKASQVFKTAHTPPQPSNNINLSLLPSSYPLLTPGRYIVELFFAEISTAQGSSTRTFDVLIEGKTLLNNYNIFEDRTKIVEVAGNPVVELDSVQAERYTGTVKRFAVEIGTDGLQILLRGEGSVPLLNGLRILRADPPRIENVIIKGSSWAKGVDYSYAEAVFAGDQLRPVYLQDANRIEVHFDSPVSIIGNELLLHYRYGGVLDEDDYTFDYDEDAHIGIWTFDVPLDPDKYLIELSTAVTGGGNALDGEWDNKTNDTPGNFADDPTGKTFLTGHGNAGTPGNVFQFAFSLLPGDRNQDGIVTSADQSVAGDVNSDGVSNGTDTTLVSTTYLNTYLPVRKNGGDYEEEEMVNEADYMLWRVTFGSTTDLRADGNNNGIVDAADYTVWADNNGAISAWYNAVVSGGGSFAPQVLVGEAPRVTNVIISGSNSTHDPFSFDTVDGSGTQLLTVPVGGADTISITFSEDVNVEANFLQLTGMRTANQPELAEFDYDIGTMTATWRYSEMFAADQYLISLNDAVTDIEGDALDGEWVNPMSVLTTNSLVSTFPSGDGNPGGAFNFAMTILSGDLSGDNIVGQPDQVLFGFFLNNPPGDPQFWHGDFNGDGVINSADQDFITQNYGNWWRDWELLADLGGDGNVDMDDLDILYANWDNGLPNPTPADGDLDDDGDIDVDDLDLAFAQFGMELSVVS